MRAAAAAAVAALAAVASYVVQRLLAAGGAPLVETQALAVEHIPYMWRCAVAGLHAGLAGMLAVGLLDEDGARRALGIVPLCVALGVPGVALTAWLVP